MSGSDRSESLYHFVDRLAERHAQPEEEPERPEEWLRFEAGGVGFGLPVEAVREVVRPRSATRVPGAPPAVRGLVNLRGQALPLVDLARHLELVETKEDDETRIVVLESRGRRVAALVQRVVELAKVVPSAVRPLKEDEARVPAAVVRGGYESEGRLWVLLEPDRVLLTGDEIES